jgi:RNA polymerase sigma-70 factor (ECF subfamily)
MADLSDAADELLDRARQGDAPARAALFARYRDRLRQMVRLRLDRRLQGRLDPSDVLQETYIEYEKRFPDWQRRDDLPFFLWLRLVAGQKLIDLHRHHLGAKMRDAGQEVSLCRGPVPSASSASLAELLLGRMTSVSQAAMKAELRLRVQDVLNGMDPIDREVLVLRHFETLSNDETAAVLGLSKTAASNRYIRALRRLKDLMASLPGHSEA